MLRERELDNHVEILQPTVKEVEYVREEAIHARLHLYDHFMVELNFKPLGDTFYFNTFYNTL